MNEIIVQVQVQVHFAGNLLFNSFFDSFLFISSGDSISPSFSPLTSTSTIFSWLCSDNPNLSKSWVIYRNHKPFPIQTYDQIPQLIQTYCSIISVLMPNSLVSMDISVAICSVTYCEKLFRYRRWNLFYFLSTSRYKNKRKKLPVPDGWTYGHTYRTVEYLRYFNKEESFS